AEESLRAKRKRDVVANRVQVVFTIGPRNDLVVLAVLADLLEAAMEVADVRDAAHDGFAIQLEHQPEDAVGGRMLRSDVDEHVLTFELGLQRRRRLERESPATIIGEDRYSLRTSLRVDTSGRQFCDDGSSLSHYSPVLSPLLRRRFMSSGSSAKASAMESSSIE